MHSSCKRFAYRLEDEDTQTREASKEQCRPSAFIMEAVFKAYRCLFVQCALPMLIVLSQTKNHQIELRESRVQVVVKCYLVK